MPKWAPANNDVPSVADLVAYIADQVISQVTAATNPSGTAGEMIYETDTTRYKAHDGSGFVQFGGTTAAALNSYTPTIDQGATTNIGKTVNYSQYQRFGNLAYWTFSVTITGTGTAGSNVTLTTPVTMATTTGGLGGGRIWDNSAPFAYNGLWIPATTTTMRLFVDTNISNSAWGVAPSIALASADAIWGSVWLPVA